MDIYASDEEKAEAIKQWWRENGRSVFIGVILGIASIFGVRYWMNYQQVQTQQAAMIYQQAIVSVSNQDSEAAQASTEKLMQDNKNLLTKLHVAAIRPADSMCQTDGPRVVRI